MPNLAKFTSPASVAAGAVIVFLVGGMLNDWAAAEEKSSSAKSTSAKASSATETHKVDVRLILATNQNLEELVAKGEFRQDLYYRVNVITITQPALRERIGDIPLLAEHFLKQFNEQTGKSVPGLTDEALHALQQYSWPGNVRELVNVIERAVVLSKGDAIGFSDLPESVRQAQSPVGESSNPVAAGSLKNALAAPERQIILEALEANGWNRQKTASMLGINRTTLYKKMKKYGVSFEKQLNQ